MIAAPLEQTDSPSNRPSLLSKTLRSVWPHSSLYACRLWDENEPHLSVLDDAGNPRPEWTEWVQKEMIRQADSRKGTRPPAPRALERLGLSGHTLAVEP